MVVGSRGHRPITSAPFGSVSQALAREAMCPVMMVPDILEGPPGGGSGVVAAVDRSAESSAAAGFAMELAERLETGS
jgi:hypothetical protein